jgi:hypothetical protein
MTAPSASAIERERDKLYLTDAELIRRLGVPERLARPTIQQLESKANFPKRQALWGNRRYWPAVKAYLDRQNGLNLAPTQERI